MGWEQVKEGGGGYFLKFESGKPKRLHVLSEEPHSYQQVFSKEANRGVIVPDDFQHKDKRGSHALVVWDLDTKEAKIWNMSNTVAADVKNIYDISGGLSKVDLVVTRIGSGLQTKYKIVNAPTKFNEAALDGLELPDPSTMKEFEPADQETIDNVLSGGTPTDYTPEETPAETLEETPAETPEETPETPEETPEEPAKPAAAKKPAPAAANGGDPRTQFIKRIMHVFATNQKFKDGKKRLEIMRKVSKKTIVSQMSLPELQKLLALAK